MGSIGASETMKHTGVVLPSDWSVWPMQQVACYSSPEERNTSGRIGRTFLY